MSMWDFLSDVNPDYESTLSVDPQQVMGLSGEKDVRINRGRGLSEERIILSSQSKFWVKLKWRMLSDQDHGTLFDFYHNPYKGCGQARSFWWEPPAQYDSHVYVVRFDSKWESFLQNYQTYGIASLIFCVLGRKPE